MILWGGLLDLKSCFIANLKRRRYVALIGGGFIMLGMVVCSTAHSMNVFIGGMTLAGVGAGISERK